MGEAVIESAVGWLNAAQIESLLLAAEANLIPISTDPATRRDNRFICVQH